jgi:transcriptional regulator with XRE-family HTH domain
MTSPFVRRRRLAADLVRLREDHGCSSADLAKAIGVARQRISRLENGHVAPSLDGVMRVLDLFKVGEKRGAQIMTIAREAQERGW